ncbi:hypothetical protein SV7mr_27550 [Stieleria bergensis]|uniref:Uncharacterized protein n=1 Tax=Stieleria bergensis TaxID=2528025 RepID=A0A517SVT4_9BACT|nr:hypothetical protein SV7mr_27550 [Planctomycetes bacterium SV_7m_r]
MIRAESHAPFFRRFLYVFLGCFAFACWFLYDGLIGYPQQRVIAEAYEAIPEEDRAEQWPEVAKENGWSTLVPAKTSKEITHGIGQQFMFTVICSIMSVVVLMKFIAGQGAYIEGDSQVIRNHKGVEVPIESITSIDKHKWEDKGIAKIRYEVDGKQRTFVMDDFKFKREPMAELMEFAEAPLDPEAILGDLPQRDKVAANDAESAQERDGDESDV